MKPLYTILLLVFLASCGEKKAALENNSPNGKIKVALNAEKSGVSPWQCELKVKAYSFKEGALKFEIYTDELSDKTVSFDWQDDNNCVISITENDGKKRTFQLLATANQVQMAEI